MSLFENDMIRKVIIVVLTLGALTVMVAEFIGVAVGPVVHVRHDLELTIDGADLWVLRLDSDGSYQPWTTPGWVPFVYVKLCNGRLDTLWLPLWVPVVVFSAYPAVAFIRGPLRRWRRRRKGLCVTCGYNLTGNVTGVCPECGEPI